MFSLRKWIFKPKKSDTALLAQFFYADEELNVVTGELDSFDGRKDPERCTALVNQLRVCQDKVLTIIEKIMWVAIPNYRANRDFRVKFPDDLLHDTLAGQLWFGAECLAAGSSIMNREVESASMRPLAKTLTKQLDTLRSLLRDQCLRNVDVFVDKITDALITFDQLFAEFELSYVSAMVPVKTMREYDMLQDVMVLFCETVQRALRLGLLSQEMIDDYDPALMFTIPRLAIVCGLLVYPEGPLNPDLDPNNMCEMFRLFQTVLYKIRELLWTLNKEELWLLEKSLCSNADPSTQQLETERKLLSRELSEVAAKQRAGSRASTNSVSQIAQTLVSSLDGVVSSHVPNPPVTLASLSPASKVEVPAQFSDSDSESDGEETRLDGSRDLRAAFDPIVAFGGGDEILGEAEARRLRHSQSWPRQRIGAFINRNHVLLGHQLSDNEANNALEFASAAEDRDVFKVTCRRFKGSREFHFNLPRNTKRHPSNDVDVTTSRPTSDLTVTSSRHNSDDSVALSRQQGDDLLQWRLRGVHEIYEEDSEVGVMTTPAQVTFVTDTFLQVFATHQIGDGTTSDISGATAADIHGTIATDGIPDTRAADVIPGTNITTSDIVLDAKTTNYESGTTAKDSRSVMVNLPGITENIAEVLCAEIYDIDSALRDNSAKESHVQAASCNPKFSLNVSNDDVFENNVENGIKLPDFSAIGTTETNERLVSSNAQTGTEVNEISLSINEDTSGSHRGSSDNFHRQETNTANAVTRTTEEMCHNVTSLLKDMSEQSEIIHTVPTVEDAEPKVEDAESRIEETEPTVEEAEPMAEEVKPTVEKAEPAIEEAELTFEEAEPTVEEMEPRNVKWACNGDVTNVIDSMNGPTLSNGDTEIEINERHNEEPSICDKVEGNSSYNVVGKKKKVPTATLR